MNIRKKFIIFSILWGIVPVIMATIICIANFNAKSIELIKQNVTTSAHDQSTNLEAFFKQIGRELNINASMPVVKDLLVSSNNQINNENEKRNIEVLNGILMSKKDGQFFLSAELLINSDDTIIASSDYKYMNTDAILSSKEIERLKHNELVITDIIQKRDFNKGIKSV